MGISWLGFFLLALMLGELVEKKIPFRCFVFLNITVYFSDTLLAVGYFVFTLFSVLILYSAVLIHCFQLR